jgi:hypothetical protein
VSAELGEHSSLAGVTILVDDSGRLPARSLAAIERARRSGARLVVIAESDLVPEGARVFEVPPLGEHAAIELVRRAVPSLTDRLVRRAVESCGGRPGELRRLVRRMAERAIASDQDLEELLHGFDGVR